MSRRSARRRWGWTLRIDSSDLVVSAARRAAGVGSQHRLRKLSIEPANRLQLPVRQLARLGLSIPTIASLRTIYQRYKTLYEHSLVAATSLTVSAIGAKTLLASNRRHFPMPGRGSLEAEVHTVPGQVRQVSRVDEPQAARRHQVAHQGTGPHQNRAVIAKGDQSLVEEPVQVGGQQ